MASHTVKGAALSLAAFALYATHDVVVKFLGASYSPFQTIFFAGLLTFPLVSVMLLTDRSGGTLIPVHPGWSILRTVTVKVSDPVLGAKEDTELTQTVPAREEDSDCQAELNPLHCATPLEPVTRSWTS